MDPFSAIGFAGNVLNFLDFSWSLLTDTYKIYKCASDAAPDAKTLTSVANDIIRLGSVIVLSPEYGQDLRKLAEECKGVADALLGVLDKLRVTAKRKTVYDSFLLALRKVWKRKDIDDFVERLQILQAQLTVRMNWLLL